MDDKAAREQIVVLLRGGEAHANVAKTIQEYPAALAGQRLAGSPNTPWRLLEHMRIAQWDIIEFCKNPNHVSPDFPDGYWPMEDSPPDTDAWDEAVSVFCADLKSIQEYVLDPTTVLHTPIPHGAGQTVFREALLVADHNSYHMGQLCLIRRGFEG